MLREFELVLSCLQQPAFVRDREQVLLVNPAAQALGLQTGRDPALEQLPPELEDGRGTVMIAERSFEIQLRQAENLQLVLCTPQQPLDAAALAAVNRALRIPLHGMLLSTNSLWPYLEEQEDALIQKRTADITRNLYQVMRTVENLTELELTENSLLCSRKRVECNGFLEHFHSQTASLVETTGRTLALNCQEKRFYAELDEMLVEQALLNLLNNAITHTPVGGTITLRGWQRGHNSCLAVVNPGAPVDGTVLSRMFDRYKQTEPDAGGYGAGFGMQAVRHIMQSHQGTVLVQANPKGQGGLTATLSFPSAAVNLQNMLLRTPTMQVKRGGFDPYKLGLSTVLDPSCFDSRE